jgi:hypothetical protein
MALDSKGYPHFVYEQNYLNTLMYASWNGSAWNTETVASNANPNMPIGFLTLDSYNYPHIDFFNISSGSLTYARWTGSIWDMQIVGPDSLATQAGPIAADSNGNVHIAYTGYPDSSSNSLVVYSMYAKAAQPIPTPPSTQAPSSPFSTFAPLVILSVIIVAIVAAVGYVWKRKISKKT